MQSFKDHICKNSVGLLSVFFHLFSNLTSKQVSSLIFIFTWKLINKLVVTIFTNSSSVFQDQHLICVHHLNICFPFCFYLDLDSHLTEICSCFVSQVPSNKCSSAENSSLMLKFIDSRFPAHIVCCG